MGMRRLLTDSAIPATHRWGIENLQFDGGASRYYIPDGVAASSRSLLATVNEATDTLIEGKHFLTNGTGGFFTSPALSETVTRGYVAFVGYNRLNPASLIGFATNVAVPDNMLYFTSNSVRLYLGGSLILTSGFVSDTERKSWMATWDAAPASGARKARLFNSSGLVASTDVGTFTPATIVTVLGGIEWNSIGLALLQLGNVFPMDSAAAALALSYQQRYV